MTAATFEHPAQSAPLGAMVRVALIVVAVALLVAAFVTGRVTASEDSTPSVTTPSVTTPAPAVSTIGQPVESCPIGQPC